MVQFPAFDGSDREALPGVKDLVIGTAAEFLAMTLFVYFGCGSAASTAAFNGGGDWDNASSLGIALQFGLSITVLAYLTAHTSGGHINCAVTWALTLVGKCHPVRGLFYFSAQMVGSILGAYLLDFTTSCQFNCPDGYSSNSTVLDRTGALGSNGLQNDEVTEGNALLGEFMGTLLLVIVVLETAVNARAITTNPGLKQSLAPIPIGLAVFMAHVFLIPLTGCSINPTRSFGPAVASGVWDDHWIWWVGPLTGATFGGLLWLGMQMLQQMQDRPLMDLVPGKAPPLDQPARAVDETKTAA